MRNMSIDSIRKQILGKWISPDHDISFNFHSNGTYDYWNDRPMNLTANYKIIDGYDYYILKITYENGFIQNVNMYIKDNKLWLDYRTGHGFIYFNKSH